MIKDRGKLRLSKHEVLDYLFLAPSIIQNPSFSLTITTLNLLESFLKPSNGSAPPNNLSRKIMYTLEPLLTTLFTSLIISRSRTSKIIAELNDESLKGNGYEKITSLKDTP